MKLTLLPLLMLVVYVSAGPGGGGGGGGGNLGAGNNGGGHTNQESTNNNPPSHTPACKDCVCCACGDPNLVTCKGQHLKLQQAGDTLLSAGVVPGNALCNYEAYIQLEFTGDADHPNHYSQFGLKGTFGKGPTLHHWWINSTSAYPYVIPGSTAPRTENFSNHAGFTTTLSDSEGCMQLHVHCGVWFKFCPKCSCIELRNAMVGVVDGVCGPQDGLTCPQVYAPGSVAP